jgi:hypothetical protein
MMNCKEWAVLCDTASKEQAFVSFSLLGTVPLAFVSYISDDLKEKNNRE